jgi:hypothetical protein
MIKFKVKSKVGPKNIVEKKGREDQSLVSSKLKDTAVIIKYYEVPEENLTLGAILHKMSEVLEMYLKTLQQILQPEEFHAIYECGTFTDKDKTKILELYKRMILAHREILKAFIINEESNSLSTIQFVHKEILGVKDEMLDVVKKMQQSWNADSKENTGKQMHYFG